MSLYEDYGRTAGHYDATRTAIGGEIWLGHLMSQFGAVEGVRVLDAGCGTGNYAVLLAENGATVTALDVNPQMLAQARAKADATQLMGSIEFHSGALPTLPFDTGRFDAVMFNQVLHHLDKPEDGGFERHHATIAEASRVLRPGGIALINTCSPEQMRDGYWYHALIPEASARGLERTISTEELEAALCGSGFGMISRTVSLDAVLQGAAGLDPKGPLDASWRSGDSIWALAQEQELERALEQVQEMEHDGSLSAFMAEHDRPRRQLGQTTFWCAVKSA